MVKEWQRHDCIWHDTECICLIKLTWLMTSLPMYVWNHTHCTHDTIGTLYDITSTLAENTPLFVWHGIHSVYEIICIIYDVWHAVCMNTQALYLAWNLLKLPSHRLCMSWQTLGQRHHTYCVRHHRWDMYAIKCTIQDIISTLYDNNIWYLCHYMHYIQYIMHIIYDSSSILYHVTLTICGTSNNDSVYDIKPYMFMTYHFIWHHTQCYDYKPLCAFTATMPDVTLKIFWTLHKMYQFYDKKWM